MALMRVFNGSALARSGGDTVGIPGRLRTSCCHQPLKKHTDGNGMGTHPLPNFFEKIVLDITQLRLHKLMSRMLRKMEVEVMYANYFVK